MKRNILILLVAVIFAACSTAEKSNFELKGTISNYEGDVYVKKSINGEKASIIDTATVVDGKFGFSFDVEGDEIITLVKGAKRSDVLVKLFVMPGEATVDLDLEDLSTVKVISSPLDLEYAKCRAADAEFNSFMADFRAKYKAAQESKNEKEVEALVAEYEKASGEQKEIKETIFDNNRTNLLGLDLAFALRIVYDADEKKLEELVGIWETSFPNNSNTKAARKILDTKIATAIGVVAPDFTQNDPEGNPITLSSLRGKVILVDFWASWCSPCRQENPNVVKMYNRFKDKGFDIIGVSLDSKKADWLKGIEDDGLVWNHVSDLGGWKNKVSSEIYGIRSIPSTMLLDENGVIIAKNLRGEELEAKIAEILE